MAIVTLDDGLVSKLNQIANQRGYSVEECIHQLLAHYEHDKTEEKNQHTQNQLMAEISALQGRIKTLELMIENVTDIVCLHQPDGTFIFVSPSAQHINGYTPQELIGTSPYDYFHPDDLAVIKESHDMSLAGDRIPSVIYRYRRKEGSYIWMEIITNPVMDEQGRVINLVTISRDVTERQEMQQQLRDEHDLLTRIMETSPSGITVVDKTGQIVFSNQRSLEIYGAPKEDVTSRSYDSINWRHTDYEGNPWPDENQPFVQVMQTKAPVWDVRHAIEWSDGRRVYLVINGAPLLDEQGEVSKVVFTVEDYTSHVLQQRELEADLERERQLNEMKTSFVSMVSHEFRTPLAVIMTSANLLRMKQNVLTKEELNMRLDKIENQIKRLEHLIADITYINKNSIVSPIMSRQTLSLLAFFSQITEEVNTAYPHHHPIQLLPDEQDKEVLLDVSLMQQIFMNLLANAMKYSPPDSSVVCQYYATPHSLEVIIRDEGIGIPEKDQAYIFEMFYRAGNIGNVAGTGLGLSIARHAVEIMQGHISFESDSGLGTTFYISLPLHA